MASSVKLTVESVTELTRSLKVGEREGRKERAFLAMAEPRLADGTQCTLWPTCTDPSVAVCRKYILTL